MEWYQFNPETGEFTQPIQCQPNPMGGFLIPANATPDTPIKTGKNQAAVFTGKQWQLIEDHRKTTVYRKTDKTELKIKTLGPIPATHTEQKPDNGFSEWNEAADKWVHNDAAKKAFKEDTEKAWAMSELALSDRTLTPDFPASDADHQKIIEYRAKLRNPARSTTHSYPETTWRPTWPEGVKRPAV